MPVGCGALFGDAGQFLHRNLWAPCFSFLNERSLRALTLSIRPRPGMSVWLRRQQKQWLSSARLGDLFLISAMVTLDSSATLNSQIVGASKLPDVLFGMAMARRQGSAPRSRRMRRE